MDTGFLPDPLIIKNAKPILLLERGDFAGMSIHSLNGSCLHGTQVSSLHVAT
jgi:hypothetical protein